MSEATGGGKPGEAGVPSKAQLGKGLVQAGWGGGGPCRHPPPQRRPSWAGIWCREVGEVGVSAGTTPHRPSRAGIWCREEGAGGKPGFWDLTFSALPALVGLPRLSPGETAYLFRKIC